MQRLDQLCDCVIKGVWPARPKPEPVISSQLGVTSPTVLSNMVDMDNSLIHPGLMLDSSKEDPAKAFQVQRVRFVGWDGRVVGGFMLGISNIVSWDHLFNEMMHSDLLSFKVSQALITIIIAIILTIINIIPIKTSITVILNNHLACFFSAVHEKKP